MTATTFKEHELAGWSAKAGAYDDYFGAVTARISPALLDAARVTKGSRLLDIACGPGYVVGDAAERGADPTGIDFAEPMVAEAFRVLRPGGRYAFSWWCANDKHEFFQLFYESVKAFGTMDVPLPPAPPFARFSDPAECIRGLCAAGFADVRAVEHALTCDMPTPRHALDMIVRSGVRSSMMLELQTKQARARIEEALMTGAMKFKRGDVLHFAFPAIVASGVKPG